MATVFRFRLEQLLGIRRQKEELAQRDLAEAQTAVAARNQSIHFLLRQQSEAMDALRGAQELADIGRLMLADDYCAALSRLIRREQESLHELVQVELDRRNRLIEARKDVRVLERFRERELRTHRQAMDLEER